MLSARNIFHGFYYNITILQYLLHNFTLKPIHREYETELRDQGFRHWMGSWILPLEVLPHPHPTPHTHPHHVIQCDCETCCWLWYGAIMWRQGIARYSNLLLARYSMTRWKLCSVFDTILVTWYITVGRCAMISFIWYDTPCSGGEWMKLNQQACLLPVLWDTDIVLWTLACDPLLCLSVRVHSISQQGFPCEILTLCYEPLLFCRSLNKQSVWGLRV